MDKTKIIEYLYGEMSPEEENAFKARLAKDPVLRKEWEAMNNTRAFLKDHMDEIPMSHPLVVKTGKKNIFKSKWWAIAASLALLMICGKLLDLRVSVGNGQLAIHYGAQAEEKQEQPVLPVLTLEELAASIDGLKKDLIDRIDKYQGEVENTDAQLETYKNSMSALVNNLKSDQERLTRDLWQQFTDDQKEYTALLVDDFVEYVDLQRQQDLRLINESIYNLAQLIQMETEQMAQYVYQPIQK